MSARAVRRNFGEPGREWVRNRLEINKLSRKRFWDLLAVYDLDNADPWAFVPADADPTELLNFRDDFVIRGNAHRVRLAEWIRSSTPAEWEGRGILCFEDAPSSSKDPWIDGARANDPPEFAKFFLAGDHVYFYEHLDVPLDVLETFLGEGSGYPVTIGIVADPGPEAGLIRRHADVPERVVEHMAAHVRAILVDAWDLAGFLVWEPSPL